MAIRALAGADASCGAKAHGLARLIATGLRVPDGFVIEPDVFAALAGLPQVEPDAIGHALTQAGQRLAHAALPAEVDREVRARAAALGRLVVRSSASIEDGVLGSAAGVFASVTDVAPDDVWDAIRTVWASALTPLAVAYARHRAAAIDSTGEAPRPVGKAAGVPTPRDSASPIAMAVIVQRFVPGARMTVYTRPIGATASAPADTTPSATPVVSGDDDLWLSRDGQIERVPRASAGARPEAAMALAAEAAIGATQGADVELVLEVTPHGTQPWLVQARPIVHPVRRRRLPPPPIVVAPLVQDGRRWTWDIAHNPDPLSPAQAGLVEAVDRAACSPYALRVCGGYLYTTPREPLESLGLPAPPADRAELTARIAAIEARFMLEEAPTVAAAVERYLAFTRIWAYELSPLVAVARTKLLDRLAHAGHPPEEIAARAASLIGPRRVLRDRVMSPAWDVVVPTFAEQHTYTAREALPPVGSPQPSPEVPPELIAEVELARAAADAAEHDDLWFARAQWLVRRALLTRSRELALRGDDIFWLPLDEVITQRTIDPDDAHRRASAARAAHARATEWDMPLVVHGDAPRGEPPPPGPLGTSLRGVGVGPRVIGRVVRVIPLAALAAAPAVGRGDVVVTRAITPALAMIVDGCAALVSETGGLLDHGAALARELGITCVVGCAGAWTQLIDGAMVFVDGDAGLIGSAEAIGATRTTTET